MMTDFKVSGFDDDDMSEEEFGKETTRDGDSVEEYLDELATAKPGEVLILDEAGELTRDQRDAFKQKFTKWTPELMERRITHLRRNLRDFE